MVLHQNHNSSSGIGGKFRSARSSSRPTGIPRASVGGGIRKKSENRTKTNSLSNLCKPAPKLRQQTNAKNTEKSSSGRESGKNPIMRRKVAEKSFTVKEAPNICSSRKVLANLSNSPAGGKLAAKTSSVSEPYSVTSQKDIEFEVDPASLVSIMNNEGVRLPDRTQPQMRASMVANNALLMPDGRPSLCRRVPIKLAQGGGRVSTSGPQRVLSAKKAGSTSQKQRSSFVQPTTSRHSLYSVIQGRYSFTANQPTRQSFHQGQKPKQTTNPVKPSSELFFKSPAQRVSRKNEVRISASPALRVAYPTPVTPPARRVMKKDRKTSVKWADESTPFVKDKLAVHLFKETPQSPRVVSKKIPKTPVSILKSRKHAKRNSLTPPVVKKEKTEEDENCVIEIISPQTLNMKDEQSISETRAESKISKAQNDKYVIGGCRTKSTEKQTASSSQIINKQKPVTQQKMIDVDKVLQIMTQHASNVKRRSVQAEFCDVIKHVAERLTTPTCDVIEEESDEETHHDVTPKTEKTSCDVTNKEAFQTSLTSATISSNVTSDESNPVNKFLTPENMKKLEESYEETHRSLDQIAMETERINEELRQLKFDKMKLEEYRQQVKQRKVARAMAARINNNMERQPSCDDPPSREPSGGVPATPFVLDNLRSLDLDYGVLEFGKLKNSPILSAKIEFARKSPCAPPSGSDRVPQGDVRVRQEWIPSSAGNSPLEELAGTPQTSPPSKATSPAVEPDVSRRTSIESSIVKNARIAESCSPLEGADTKDTLLGKVPVDPELHVSIESGSNTSCSLLTRNKVTSPVHDVSEVGEPLTNERGELGKLTSDTLSRHNESVAKDEYFNEIHQQVGSFLQNLSKKKPTDISHQLPGRGNHSGRDILPIEPSTALLNPHPSKPLPPQTPAAFRALRKQFKFGIYKESPKSKMKQQFTQVLLDEEVSLLTCKIVRPTFRSKSTIDPVAISLCDGDQTHFVPIVATPKANKSGVESNKSSAFSNYLPR